MATLVYPTAAELRLVEQEFVRPLVAQDPLLQAIFPIETSDDHLLAWEQMDNYIGLQQVRGLDGAFAKVNKVGAKRYIAEPGIYGEYIDLNETELTRRRQLGTPNQLVDVSDMVMSAQAQLLGRRYDRIRYIAWTLLTTGTFSVAGPAGGVLHTDTYSVQTQSAAVSWGTVATATPIADFRTVQALGPAKGVSFGAGATAFMNRFTYNRMMSNTNSADLGGRRSNGLVPINDREALNRYLSADDLPSFLVYDEGYYNDSASFTRFIPNSKVVIVGKRPSGVRIGAYRMTRNINNPGFAPGPYTEVRQEPTPPKGWQVFDGHNGGPIIEFPGAVCILDVS
jgi:hypothetical protein